MAIPEGYDYPAEEQEEIETILESYPGLVTLLTDILPPKIVEFFGDDVELLLQIAYDMESGELAEEEEEPAEPMDQLKLILRKKGGDKIRRKTFWKFLNEWGGEYSNEDSWMLIIM